MTDRKETIKLDTNNEYDWSKIVWGQVKYNEDLHHRYNKIYYDDGSVFETVNSYSYGTWSTRYINTDSPTDGGDYDWSEQSIYFDNEGTYDISTIYDDGTEEYEHSESGSLKYRIIVDTDAYVNDFSNVPTGNHIWKSQQWKYDEQNDDIYSHTTLFDNGLVVQNQYEGTELTKKLLGDAADTFDWKYKKSYDEKQLSPDHILTGEATMMDDGDTYSEFYINGVLSAELFVDNDNSEEYFAKRVEYDDEGNIENVKYFDSPEDSGFDPDELPNFNDELFKDMQTLLEGISVGTM